MEKIIAQLVPVCIVLLIFWLLIIYPNIVKEREKRKKIDALKINDKITTLGGIEGKVVEINLKTIKINTAETLLEINKNYINEIKIS